MLNGPIHSAIPLSGSNQPPSELTHFTKCGLTHPINLLSLLVNYYYYFNKKYISFMNYELAHKKATSSRANKNLHEYFVVRLMPATRLGYKSSQLDTLV